MWIKQKQTGFTIVELLIVIVVIGILAAITIVAYNGVQDRARASVLGADFTNNNKVAKVISASTGNTPTTLDILQSATKMNTSTGIYKLVSFCASSQGYVLAAETLNGNKYYSLNGTGYIQNNSIDVANACPGLGLTSADKIFLGMPAGSCATENGTCSVTDTVSVAYGSVTTGKFTAKNDLTGSISCSNAFFGDPASGFPKACYILHY